MSFVEFFGFIITMLLFFILIAKQARDEMKRKKNPEQEKEQEKAVKDMLRSLNIEVEEEEEEITPVVEKEEKKVTPQVPSPLEFEKSEVFRRPHEEVAKEVDFRKFETPHEAPYVLRMKQQARVKEVFKEARSLRDMIIIREILGPPKGM